MDSDSDDNLEDVPFLLPKSPYAKPSTLNNNRNENLTASAAKNSIKLDELLSEHREQAEKTERLQRIKVDLQEKFSLTSSQEIQEQETINPELSRVIDNLNVTTTELPQIHPTSEIFRKDKFCCLFEEDVDPFLWEFNPSTSDIDKLLADIRPDLLRNFLLSEVLPMCFHEVSCPHSVMIWLFSLISIHSSDLIVEAGAKNVLSIVRRLKASKAPNQVLGGRTNSGWCPTPLQLLSVFVNMGASASELLVNQTAYTDEDVRQYLNTFDRKGNKSVKKSHGCVGLNNCQKLFDVLARCLQTRPNFSKEELNSILVMIMKVSLDDSFKNLDLQRQFQACISSVLDCYTDSDWPAVVPDLCHQINSISHHHHSQVYLTDLLPMGDRARYLQIRLSFLMLCSVLGTEGDGKQLNLHLPNISPLSIAQLGCPCEDLSSSKLTEALKHLMKDNVYKMRSAVHLLDRAMGDELNRCKQPVEELEYLIGNVKEVIKGIRDNIFGLDQSRVKDAMTYMTFKWMSASTKNSKCVQRSIFPWATSAANPKEEVLEDSLALSSDEEAEEAEDHK